MTRRDALLGMGSAVLLGRADAQVTPDMVQFRPEIEPLVRLMEITPRERCAEMLVEQLRRGVSYRQLLAALFLAAIRNVNPQPPGFALHSVFIIHAAHLLAMEAPPDSRLLPLFYALDNFKTSQDRDSKQTNGDYVMRPIAGSLPGADRAADELKAAMEAWDQERAERAAAGMARHGSAAAAFQLLRRYGARDYRNIGHKAIYVANASRTLETIGWQHAEPVLRSLVLALLDFGKDRKVDGYAFEDQCYLANAARVKAGFGKLSASPWTASDSDPSAVRALWEAIRSTSPEEACAEAGKRLVGGTAGANSVWDAVHLSAAELAMRGAPAATIQGIHTVSAVNGLHHAYVACGDPSLQFLLVLQGVGWVGQFRKLVESRADRQRAFSIMDMEPLGEGGPQDRRIEETFAAVPSKVDEAASRVMKLATDPGSRQAFLSAAVRTTLAKGDEVHFYKFLAAILEDTALVGVQWQPRFLAASVHYMKGPSNAEPIAIKRAREAMRALPA